MNKEYFLEIAKSFFDMNEINGKIYYNENRLDYNPPDNYEIRSGASKLVLISDDEDYVIKIPFAGYTYSAYRDSDNSEEESDDDDNDNDNSNDELEDYFEEFHGATEDNENCWDYCYKEELIGFAAEQSNYEKIFIPTLYIDELNNNRIYVQKKINTPNVIKYPSRESRQIYDDKYSDENYIGNELGGLFIDIYGEEEANNIMKFIRDNGVGDLHRGNYYVDIDKIIIFDYAGYNE